MHQSKEEYKKYADYRAKRSPVLKNCLAAFLFGGLICSFGQCLFTLYSLLGATVKDS